MTQKPPVPVNVRVQKHIDKAKKGGGKRQPFVLTGEAVESLAIIRKIEGDPSDTAVVNRLLVDRKNQLLR